MKKIITFLVIFTMLLSLTACGGGNKDNTPSSEDKTPDSIQQEDQTSEVSNQEDQSSEGDEQDVASEGEQQEDQTSDDEQTDSISTDDAGEDTNVVVAPKSPDDPAPLVSRQVDGLTQEQVSEVYKFVYFTMGVPYEDIDQAIIDDDILFYWTDLEWYANEGINPYESFELYFVEKNDIEWPTADYIHDETKYTGTGNVVKIDNPNTFDQDGYECWRVYIDQASVDEVSAYMDALKKNGFTFTSTPLVSEERAAGEFDFIGQYEWQGTNEYGVYLTFLHTQEQTTEFTGTDLTQLIICLYSQNPNS